VNEPIEVEFVRGLGVDTVITDRPLDVIAQIANSADGGATPPPA
jgi:hypothetical protein